jgi:phage terminase small subunit
LSQLPARIAQVLTPKHLLFVEAVLAGLAPWVAAREAGYTIDSLGRERGESELRMVASRLMCQTAIVNALREVQGIEVAPLIATRAERQAFLTSVLAREDVHMRDRLKAVELLGRMRGDFVERRRIIEEVSKDPRKLSDEQLERLIYDAKLAPEHSVNVPADVPQDDKDK